MGAVQPACGGVAGKLLEIGFIAAGAVLLVSSFRSRTVSPWISFPVGLLFLCFGLFKWLLDRHITSERAEQARLEQEYRQVCPPTAMSLVTESDRGEEAVLHRVGAPPPSGVSTVTSSNLLKDR